MILVPGSHNFVAPFTSGKPEDALLKHFDQRLAERGDTPEGAWWPNEHDRRTRFDVMLDLLPDLQRPVTLCDLGCGTGELLAHIRRTNRRNVTYIGVDRSQAALAHAIAKFPGTQFLELDINDEPPGTFPACDYFVANGLFTAKFDIPYDQMFSFLNRTVTAMWHHARRGIAFNVMSKVVDWEREDLFHVPMDDAARILHGLAGRRVRFRADYGLYEYTCYAYKTC
jgi:SAM-dependent methyltransferase